MTEANDLFIRASKEAFRYPSVKGELTTEQLWDMPLLAHGRGRDTIQSFDLDTVARHVNAELKELGEESFVETENPKRAVAAAKLDVVKFVIAAKQAEAKAAEQRAERNQQRRKILDAIANKDEQELSAASKEELLKKLEALDAAEAA